MSGNVALIGGCAGLTVLIRALGPAVFGGRALSPRAASVIVLLAPALLAALVVTQALADGSRLAVSEVTAGVAVGGLVAWRARSVTLCVLVAAGVTATLRRL